MLREFSIEKDIIRNKDVPLTSYNYSYLKDRLREKYHQQVSLPTIIDRAKKHGFYLKKPKRTLHDREVLTRYVGELIQHAVLVKQETTWAHILALQTLILRHGLPYAYYVDSPTVFFASSKEGTPSGENTIC